MSDSLSLQPEEARTAPPHPVAATAAPRRRPAERLVSLDAYRGFIMILLAASGFGIARLARRLQRHEVVEMHEKSPLVLWELPQSVSR